MKTKMLKTKKASAAVLLFLAASFLSLGPASAQSITGSFTYGFEAGLLGPSGFLTGGEGLEVLSGYGHGGGYGLRGMIDNFGQIKEVAFNLAEGLSWSIDCWIYFQTLYVPIEQVYGFSYIKLLELHGTVDSSVLALSATENANAPTWALLYGDSGGVHTALDNPVDEPDQYSYDWMHIKITLAVVPREGGGDWTASVYINDVLGVTRTWEDTYGSDIGAGHFGVNSNLGATFSPEVTVYMDEVSIIDPPLPTPTPTPAATALFDWTIYFKWVLYAIIAAGFVMLFILVAYAKNKQGSK